MKVVFALLLAALLSLSSNAPLVLAATETQLPPFSYDQLGADLPSSNAYHPFGFQPDGSDSVVAPPGSPEVAFPFQAPSLPPDMSPQQRAEAAGLHNYDQQLGPSPYNLNLAEVASRSAPYVATTQVQAQAPAMQAYFNNPAAGYNAQPQYPRFQQQQGYYSNGAYTVAPGQGAMYHPSPQPAYTVGPAGAQLTESVDALNVSPRFIEQMAKSLPDPRSVLPRASRSKYAAGASGPYPVPVSSPPGASGPQRRPPPPPSAADASRFKETPADSSDAAVPPPIDEVNKQLPRFVQRHASAAQAASKQHKSTRAHRVSSLSSKPPPTVSDDQDEMPASSEAGIDDVAIDPSAAAAAAQSIDDKFPPPPPQDAAVPPPPQAADPDALGDGTDADHDTVPDPTMPADNSLPGGFDTFDHSGDGAGAADPLSPMPLNDGDAAPATPGVLNREEPQPEEATPLQPLVDADSHKFMQKGLSTADMAAAAAAADAASAAKVGASTSARTAAQANARAAAAAAAAAALDQPAPAPAAPTPITPSLSTDLSGAATASVAPAGAAGAPGAGDPLAAPAPRNDGQLYKCVGNGESCKLSFNPNDIDWKVVTVPEGTFGKTQAGAAGSNPQLDQQVAQQGAVAAGAIKSGPLSTNPAIAALQTKYYQKRAEVERDKLWLLKVKQIISNYQVKMRTVQSSISERTRQLAGDRQQIMNLIKQEKAQYLAKELQIALQSLQKLEGASRSLNMKISQLGKTKSGLSGTIARLRNALGGAASGGMGDISVPSSTGSSDSNFLTVGADSAYTPSSTTSSPTAAVTDALSSNFALLEEQSPKSHIDLRRLMEMQEANKEGHSAIRDVISLLEQKAKRVAAAEESLVPPPVYDLPQVGSDPVTHVLSDRAPSPSHGRHHSMMADFEPASEELAFQRKLQRIIAAEQNM